MKIKPILVVSFATFSLTAVAQSKSRQAAKTPIYSIEHCLEHYMFEEAEILLEKSITALKRRKQPTDVEEAELNIAQKGKKMIHATQKITFVDSIVVDKSRFMQSYRIGSESGRITSYNDFFTTKEEFDGMVYVTERGNKCYFSRPTQTGGLELCTSDYIGGKWTSPAALEGLGNQPVQNYPFMCADGITLYYAAEGDESLGGYDIYVTRYNSANQQFVRSENIGMPFNSPANDYLYAIDEINNLGWFVTDRNQEEEKVCVYIFIPTETREVYNYTTENREQVARAARIYSIAETWGDQAQLQQARQRLNKLLKATQISSTANLFEFVINDHTTYTSSADFKQEEAKKLIVQWQEDGRILDGKTKELMQLRDQYSAAENSLRKTISEKILAMEKEVEQLKLTRHQQEKTIRRAELNIK